VPTEIRAKIVDASAIVAVIFREAGWEDVAQRLRGAALVAPTLLRYEVANVCLTKMRRHSSLWAELNHMFDVFWQMEIKFVEAVYPDLLELAHRTNLSAYDASYLWLAQRLDAELITLDRKLADAAAALR
jgi:predicted nucleic acid-binding protein